MDLLYDDDEYATLGLAKASSPSLAQVKAAYRQRAKELHPDRLPRDMPEAERDAAMARFRKVQAAYEQLSTQLGGRGTGGTTAGREDAAFGAGEGGERRSGRRGRRSRGGDDDF